MSVLREFETRDGSRQVVLHREPLQALRDAQGRPVIINPGYRSPSHNEAVGGSPNS